MKDPIALWALVCVGIACGAAASAATTEPTSAPVDPLPWIGVRDGRFVTMRGHIRGEKPFAPMGVNYIRLRPKWHGTFSPKVYDAARVEAMLADVQASGLNTVRVFIDPATGEGIVETAESKGFSKPYMANFLDFLTRANRHRVYVIPSLLALPAGKDYNDLLASLEPLVPIEERSATVALPRKGFGHGNEMYLDSAFVVTKARYVRDFIGAISAHNSDLLSTVLAYELDNETHFWQAAPFAQKSGTLVGPDGKEYDTAKDADLQALADAAVKRWAFFCVAAAHPPIWEGMVSINVFTFAAVGRTGPGRLLQDTTKDRRFPARPLALVDSRVPYLDIHFYPFDDKTLARDLASIEWDALSAACKKAGKPLIMGEFGSFKKNHKTLPEAAAAMASHLAAVRKLGFQGFLYWTYDCDEQTELWNAKSGKGEIMEVLRQAARTWQPKAADERN